MAIGLLPPAKETPVELWHRHVPPPRRRPEALGPIDVYLLFRTAFLADLDMRIATRGEPESLTVLLDCQPHGRGRKRARAWVSIPWAVLEAGARSRIEREAWSAARRFHSAETCASKRHYTTREEADAALVALLRMALRRERPGRRPDAERRSYWCEHCGGYHLTSQERRSGRLDAPRAAA